MSTYLYLACLDHDPPLFADDESGQHLYDLPQIRADIARRAEMVAQVPYRDPGRVRRHTQHRGGGVTDRHGQRALIVVT